jgi:hypothetical protein
VWIVPEKMITRLHEKLAVHGGWIDAVAAVRCAVVSFRFVTDAMATAGLRVFVVTGA